MSDKLEPLRVAVFPGVQNLPSFAAQANGFFATRGIAVTPTFVKNSGEMRNGLAEGGFDLVHGAVDNALALADVAGRDIAIFIGLDDGFNKLFVQPGVTGYEGLRGKILAVDAPNTAFALVAYEMLARHGLRRGADYKVEEVGATRFRLEAMKAGRADFTIINLPFSLHAEAAGLRVLDDPVQVLGPYQSTAGFALRAWIERHRDLLVRYLAAYIEGVRWAVAPANREAAAKLLQARLELSPEIAAQCLRAVTDPASGFAKDAKLDRAGFEQVLALRAGFTGGGAAPPAARYVDETAYAEALATLG